MLVSMKWRVLIPTVALIICLVGATTTLNVSEFQHNADQEFERRALMSSRLIEPTLASALWNFEAGDAQEALDGLAADPDLLIATLSSEGEVFAEALRGDVLPENVSTLTKALGEDRLLVLSNASGDYLITQSVVKSPDGDALGELFLVYDRSSVSAKADDILITGLQVAVGAVVIAAAMMLFIAASISRPLLKLSSLVHRVANNELDDDTVDTRITEIAGIATAVDVFRDNAHSVRRLEEERERAVADAEESRRDMMRQLREAFGKAVDNATQGDFSHPVRADFSDSELNKLSDSVNCLLATVHNGLNETGRIMERLADFDLTEQMEGNFKGAFGDLQRDVNRTISRLSEIVSLISDASHSLKTESDEIVAGSENLSSRAESQAASLEETARTMDDVSSSVRVTAEGAEEAFAVAAEAQEVAESGRHVAEQAVENMRQMSEAAEKISNITAMVDGIAFQTNLLALNAAVEAARAGEAGKGFAVVAQEVRSLAERASNASKDISAVIAESQTIVEGGVERVHETGKALVEIGQRVAKISETSREITRATKDQSAGVEGVSNALNEMDEETQSSVSLSQKSADAAKSLAELAGRLEGLVSSFILKPRSKSMKKGDAAA